MDGGAKTKSKFCYFVVSDAVTLYFPIFTSSSSQTLPTDSVLNCSPLVSLLKTPPCVEGRVSQRKGTDVEFYLRASLADGPRDRSKRCVGPLPSGPKPKVLGSRPEVSTPSF